MDRFERKEGSIWHYLLSSCYVDSPITPDASIAPSHLRKNLCS